MRKLGNISAAGAKSLTVPGEIRRAVSESGCRYGLIVSDIGFLKNPNQYKAERALETTTKVMGAVFSNTIEVGVGTQSCQNGVYALVFDNQSGKVVWFGAQPRRYKKNPVEPKTVNAQVEALFKDFK